MESIDFSAHLHGGARPGRGPPFRVRFPVADEEASPMKPIRVLLAARTTSCPAGLLAVVEDSTG